MNKQGKSSILALIINNIQKLEFRNSDRKMATSAELKQQSLGELFKAMSQKKSDIDESHHAFREFHRRYSGRLGTLCEALVSKRRHTSDGLALEIYRQTLEHVYLKAASFKTDRNSFEGEHGEQLIMSWMGQIAEAVLDELMKADDQFRRVNVLVPDFYDYANEVCLYGEEDAIDPVQDELDEQYYELLEIQVKRLNAALKKLNSVEKEILKEYFSMKGVQKYLDKEKITYLCRRLKRTHDNILHIKKRALDKLDKELKRDEENQDTEPRKPAAKKSGYRKRA